jgi:hypothetical protein
MAEISFLLVLLYYALIKNFFIQKGNLFRWDASIIITNHFEDTPREAVKAKTLAASLLFGPSFSIFAKYTWFACPPSQPVRLFLSGQFPESCVARRLHPGIPERHGTAG